MTVFRGDAPGIEVTPNAPPLDVARDQLVVVKQAPLDGWPLIHRRERRYRLSDASGFEELLRSRGAPVEYIPGREESLITTIYLDTPAGTWTRGESKTKFRLRNYDLTDQWWFELKRRENGMVDKWRIPVASESVPGILAGVERSGMLAEFVGVMRLEPLFGLRYRRVAFEWDGLRVTIDRGLECFRVDRDSGYKLEGSVGCLPGALVEVKSDGKVPGWLKAPLRGHRAKRSGKARWAMTLLGLR